ncbi:hypothetical protein G6F58_013034 [Rhizopus delemar]|nr:hypothetical protein G6F58_013034 [Rhizopus delemar]
MGGIQQVLEAARRRRHPQQQGVAARQPGIADRPGHGQVGNSGWATPADAPPQTRPAARTRPLPGSRPAPPPARRRHASGPPAGPAAAGPGYCSSATAQSWTVSFIDIDEPLFDHPGVPPMLT